MDINRVKPAGQLNSSGITSVSKGSGGKSSGSFQDQLGGQMKEHYRDRAAAIMDELKKHASDILDKSDLDKFEKYRGLISELLGEVTRNAYALSSERITDGYGRQRVYATVAIVDEKLDALAADLLLQDSKKIDLLGRIDEIRGLIMDILS